MALGEKFSQLRIQFPRTIEHEQRIQPRNRLFQAQPVTGPMPKFRRDILDSASRQIDSRNSAVRLGFERACDHVPCDSLHAGSVVLPEDVGYIDANTS
jgi:hypothetical protein